MPPRDAPIRAVVLGLGTIGLETLERLAFDPGFVVVGCADPHPDRRGRDPGTLLRAGRPLGFETHADPHRLLETVRADIAFVTTGSAARDVAPLAGRCLRAGISVIASAEELAEPALHPVEERELREAAARGHSRFLATGVNPGFVLDFLPVALASASARVDRIVATRVVDSLTRRPQLRAKTGAGLDAEQFSGRAAAGSLGHVGLRESAALVAGWLGKPAAFGDIDMLLEPVVAEVDVATPEGHLVRGCVAGIRQVATVGEAVHLELVIAAGARDPGDHIRIEGDPPLEAHIRSGRGEEATVGRLARAAAPLLAQPPGVYTVLELPLLPRRA